MSKLAAKIAKEKARLEKKAEDRQTFEKIDWYKPDTGENMIRLLPHPEDSEEIPFKQVKIHYVSKELDDGRSVSIPVRCMTDFDKECPLCTHHHKALKAKNKELASQLRPQERYLYNVLDYKTRKVMPWAAGVTIHQLIMEHAGDLDNPFDPESGRDWKLVKKIDSRKPRPLNVTYSIRPVPKDSAIPSKYATTIEEGSTDLETLYATEELAAMKAHLAALDLEGGDDEEEDEDDRPVKKSAKSKSKAREEEEDDEEEEVDDDDEDTDDDDDTEEEEDDEAEMKAKAKAKAAKAKAAAAKAKSKDDDEDEDDEDDEDDPPPKKTKSGKKYDERDEDPDDEPEDDDEDEDEDEDDEPPKKKSSKAAPPAKKKSKKSDDDDIDVEDEDLEKELRDLGVE